MPNPGGEKKNLTHGTFQSFQTRSEFERETSLAGKKSGRNNFAAKRRNKKALDAGNGPRRPCLIEYLKSKPQELLHKGGWPSKKRRAEFRKNDSLTEPRETKSDLGEKLCWEQVAAG